MPATGAHSASSRENQAHANSNSRLEAFCDGVFAFALTLLIIDIKLPESGGIGTTAELWSALGRLAPAVIAFLTSFAVIFITWVNHHAALKLVGFSTAAYIYANGFLLLTVVAIPFPTSLVGTFLLTDHAAPAVVLYDAVLALQGLPWALMGEAALTGNLSNDASAEATIRLNKNRGYKAIGLYAGLAITAVWFPLTAAIITMLTWAFWLVLGLRLKHE